MTAVCRHHAVLVVVVCLWAASAAAQVPTAASTDERTDPPPVQTEWHVLPLGLLFGPYLAGEKESRISWAILRERDHGVVWDMAVGARVGLVRRGSPGATGAAGWQVDLEAAAMPRLDPEFTNNMEAVDYRVGLLWTRRWRDVAVKAGYYHLSAHLGDEFLTTHPGVIRLDYVRDSALVALMYDLPTNVQVYAEVAYAFIRHGGAEPLEFQVGAQYGTTRPTSRRGGAVAAVNVHLRQELGLGGSVNLMAGWGWFSQATGHRLRLGIQAYAGKSVQYSTFRRSERMIGPAVWYDF
jgi:hypothetical protein